MIKPILGFDFGNFYSQLYCILNLDPKTRSGGTCIDLQDPTAPNPNGIPSAFFYSQRRGMLFGHQAEAARPMKNIVRYMKRHLRDSITIDGRTFTYAEIITLTVQECIRKANRQLQAQTQQTTNLISLSYPVGLEAGDRCFLKELVEKATLEDGKTHVKVVGTITEPAAAALDYLAEHPGNRSVITVMAYDLGAGTFDLSLVKAFPKGKTLPSGKTCYYETLWSDGIVDLGGLEFDKVVYSLLVSKLGITPTGSAVDSYMNLAEDTKRKLTYADEVYPDILDADEDICITRAEFNRKAQPLVDKTAALMRKALSDPNLPQPDLILLTGGASQMPIVLSTLEKAFPTFKGKIIPHRPSKAIALGAARFGTDEEDNSFKVMLQRTTRALGIRHYKSLQDPTGYITTQVPHNTPLPMTGAESRTYTLSRQQYLLISVYEATTSTPDKFKPDTDFRHVIKYKYDFGKIVEPDTPVCHEILIDKDNILHLSIWEPGRKAQTLKTVTCNYNTGA